MLRSVRTAASGWWLVAGAARARRFWPLATSHWPLLLLAATLAHAQILPGEIGPFTRAATKTVGVPDRDLYGEYGLDVTEQAEYRAAGEKGAARRFSATLWRFRDSTGAMALFQLRRPPGATPATLTDLSVRTSDGVIFAYGNYVFQLTGSFPDQADLDQLYRNLPKLEQSPLPALMGYLPAGNLVPNSERYVLGPVSLERFEPRIPPSMAAFSLGAEAQTGTYRGPKGDMTLALFNYPTPSLARERFEAFLKLPGAVAKRTGPLVAVIVQPPDPDEAERVLGKIRYQANLTVNEPIRQDFNLGLSNMILSIMALAGVLIGFSIIVGIGFGGFRILLRKLGLREDPGAMTVLRIRDKTPGV